MNTLSASGVVTSHGHKVRSFSFYFHGNLFVGFFYFFSHYTVNIPDMFQVFMVFCVLMVREATQAPYY